MGMMNKMMNFLGLQDEEEFMEGHEQMDDFEEEETNTWKDKRRNKGNVVSIHSQKNMRMVLSEPRSYEETQEIADRLRSRHSVIVNLQRVRKEQAMRIVDFLSGTVYALNGTISKVGPNIFLCTPESVEVQGSISDLFEDQEQTI